MKKRGVRKGSRQTKRSAKANPKKAVPSRAAQKTVAPKRSTRQKQMKKPARHPSESVLAKDERLIKKEVKFLLSPQEFHVVTFVTSLIVLGFLFSSKSLVFYAVLTIGALLFAHYLKQHHRPHDVIAIIGIFFIPLLITLVLFRDFLLWMLFIVFVVSVISTWIIYYHHKKEHSILKVMWQVTYSKIVAITLALVVAALLPLFVLPDSFLSMFEMIFIYVLPVSIVFFFMSKFLYLYFFDRKHIRHDLYLGLRHGVIFALIFMVLIMCIYSMYAVQFHNEWSGRYEHNVDTALISVANVQSAVQSVPVDISSLPIMKDVDGFATVLYDEISLEKSLVSERTLSFEGVMDDSYFRDAADDGANTVRFVVLTSQLYDLKGDVMDGVYSEVTLPDDIRTQVDQGFTPYSEDSDINDMLSVLNDPLSSYSDFEDTGLFYLFTEETGLTVLYDSDSIIGRQFFAVLKHTVPFREIARLGMNIMIFLNKEAGSSSAMEHIYYNRNIDTDELSTAIRYGMISNFMDDTKNPDIDLKVD